MWQGQHFSIWLSQLLTTLDLSTHNSILCHEFRKINLSTCKHKKYFLNTSKQKAQIGKNYTFDSEGHRVQPRIKHKTQCMFLQNVWCDIQAVKQTSNTQLDKHNVMYFSLNIKINTIGKTKDIAKDGHNPRLGQEMHLCIICTPLMGRNLADNKSVVKLM